MKNLPIIALVLVVAAAGIYFYLQRDVVNLTLDGGDALADSMNTNALLFMQRRAQLEQLSIDNTLFVDPRFKALRSFTTPVPERPVGRDNPFLPAERADS